MSLAHFLRFLTKGLLEASSSYHQRFSKNLNAETSDCIRAHNASQWLTWFEKNYLHISFTFCYHYVHIHFFRCDKVSICLNMATRIWRYIRVARERVCLRSARIQWNKRSRSKLRRKWRLRKWNDVKDKTWKYYLKNTFVHDGEPIKVSIMSSWDIGRNIQAVCYMIPVRK